MARANFVVETTSTVGLGDYELIPVAGRKTFVAGIGDGESCTYSVENGVDFEVRVGVVTDGSPDTISRGTIEDSSNGGADVNWGSGTKIIRQHLSAAEADAMLTSADLGVSVQAYEANNALIANITYETLDSNGDVGTGSAQLASGDHNHSGVYEPVNANILRTTDKAVANGLATLGADSKIPSSQLPSIAITDTWPVVSEVAQLALTVQKGDIAVRSDEKKTYIALNATNASMSDWQILDTPTDAVTTVNGQAGTVVLDAADVGAEPADGTILKDADIGVNVQAYSATNALKGDITYEQLVANGDVGDNTGQVAVGSHLHIGVYEPANATLLKDSDIGGTVQGYDVDTAKTDIANTWDLSQTFTKAPIETKTVIGAATITVASGSVFTKTATSGLTFSVAGVSTTGLVNSFILELTNGGAYTITWWSGVEWPAGTAPTLTTAGTDVLGFYTHDGGTTWRGLVLGLDLS